MKAIKPIILSLFALLMLGCSSDKHDFPLDKRYWDTSDYNHAVREFRFGYKDDEQLPRFDDPESRIIVQKLTDEQNFRVVLEDEELGLSHRSNVAQKFFEEWRDMSKIYAAKDRKDQYIYEIEMLAVEHFGLGLQLRYFDLGNQQMIKSSDDPNSRAVKSRVNSNVSTLLSNYMIYLDEVNTEDAFSAAGQQKFAEGIDKYFIELIDTYPNHNYTNLKTKAELLLKKSKSAAIQSSLQNLIDKLGS